MVDTFKTNDVSRVTFKSLGGTVKQMVIQIPRLAKGTKSKTSIKVEIEKRNIVAPSDTSQLKFAEVKSRQLRVFLSPSPNIESRDEQIKTIAESLPIEDGDNAWDQVAKIYQWVQDNIEYKFDPKIRTCTFALKARHGDCEELSSLFIALCRARGIPARAVWIPGHTYPEFYLSDQYGKGHWFPCQSAGPAEFGSMTESKPILQKGDKFRVAGHREFIRYVQPTITATDASLGPKLRWIMEKVN